MNDSALMGNVNCTRKRRDQPRRINFRLRPPGENGIQTSTFQQLECDIRKVRNLANIKDRDNIRVAEIGHRLCLDPKSRQILWSCQASCSDHLDGNQPVQPKLPRLVNDAHSAVPEYFQEIVAIDLGKARVDCATGILHGRKSPGEWRQNAAFGSGLVIERALGQPPQRAILGEITPFHVGRRLFGEAPRRS